jgi:RES domain-containing protein
MGKSDGGMNSPAKRQARKAAYAAFAAGDGAALRPPGWNEPVAPAGLRKFGDDWVAAADSVVLAVPSAVVPGEWNYLINPTHPDFAGLTKTPPGPFLFDHRLA